jgi:hypothetical protein
MIKIWVNDARIDCKAPSNFDRIDSQIELKEKLVEFEGLFQQDELMEV